MSVAASRVSLLNHSRQWLKLATYKKLSPIVLAVGSSLLIPASTVASCEKSDKGLFEELTLKDDNGNTDWMKTASQVQGAEFWDKVATSVGSQVQGAVDTGVPTQLSYGFICGYSSGYALKKAGRVAAVVLGMGFMGLQTLNYYGYVTVDHVKIKSEVESFMDLNSDGKVDKDDAAVAYSKVTEILSTGVPAGGGFAAGFIGGLRSG